MPGTDTADFNEKTNKFGVSSTWIFSLGLVGVDDSW